MLKFGRELRNVPTTDTHGKAMTGDVFWASEVIRGAKMPGYCPDTQKLLLYIKEVTVLVHRRYCYNSSWLLL